MQQKRPKKTQNTALSAVIHFDLFMQLKKILFEPKYCQYSADVRNHLTTLDTTQIQEI